ncbi:MAG: hypothetical protein ACFB0A_00850 [Croceivirga sp.]
MLIKKAKGKKQVAFYLGILLLLGCSEDARDQMGQPEMESDINSAAQEEKVTIPDMAFEQALIDLNYDAVIDGEVTKSQIDFVTELSIDSKGISDLTGISGFEALKNLNIRDNNLERIDLSQNSQLLFIWAKDNQLEEIDISGLSALEKFEIDRNVLKQINIGTNSALQLLTLSNNQLNDIDVSSNTALANFTVVDNPLNCILVNQTQFNAIPPNWSKDEADSYSLDCD